MYETGQGVHACVSSHVCLLFQVHVSVSRLLGAYLKYARSAASVFMQRAVARVLVLLLYSLGEIIVSLSLYLLLALLVFSSRLLQCSITITSRSVSV